MFAMAALYASVEGLSSTKATFLHQGGGGTTETHTHTKHRECSYLAPGHLSSLRFARQLPHMHSGLEVAQPTRGNYHAKTHKSLDTNAVSPSGPAIAGVKRKRLTVAIKISTTNKTAFNSNTAP